MFKIDSGVDTGPIVGQVRIPMSKRETATELYHKVTLAHRQLIAETWQSLVECNVQLMPQDESLSTYWPGRTPRDGALSLDMLCEEADCLIRATTSPYPGAYLDVLDERLRIWAGHILDADGHVPAGARLIRFRDGTLVATSFTVESI
jgi:methionyl-tRNA formyltransferase